MNVKSLISAAVATAALSAAAAAQAAVIVQDGSFTAPTGGAGYVTYTDGSSMGPWTVNGSVDLIGGYWQSPPAGGGSVDLNGNSQGGITQNLGVLRAGLYDLTFYLSGNPDGLPTVKTLDVSVGGFTDTFTSLRGSNHSKMNFVLETVGFTSDGVNPTSLSFSSGDTGFYGPVIGDVSIAAVPEPATWAMLIVGLGMIGFAARRRRDGVALAA